MDYLSHPKNSVNALLSLVLAVAISACSSTQSSTPLVPASNQAYDYEPYQYIDVSCKEQAIDMDNFAQRSGQTAQYLASAKAMLRCVDGIQFSKRHPDADQALRLMALSVMNFIKGGDIDAANIALSKARNKFPDKDLYFADYSSFFDTATALLNQQNLSPHQLTALNIPANLRTEIERNQYWLSH
ncbi:hypothetical protein RS130_23175 [Paraglaciecola aquimarina]|uniref:Lipoprotein n=1 Tax=Paraglaciecola aquimarina TaxID=1235557 RepID=A0ABU3T2B2_9ALTE|nr:hypothetical protein [Paraglaciecola aquimarina]MDU0356409.1 hypothetical protein [Paraglaciecola aquimarina]